MDPKNTKASGPRVFYYQGTLPPALALLLVAPLLLVFLSFAAMLVAGGTVAALFLPLFLRGRLRRPERDNGVITLERDQYSQVDRDTPQLPPQ
jgi:hypothetical protein